MKMKAYTEALHSFHRTRDFRFDILWVGFLMLMPGWQPVANAGAGDDTITFRNGDRISGRLKIATRHSVVFNGHVTGNVSLHWADIQELSLASGDMLIVSTQQPSGTLVTAPLIGVAGTELHIKASQEGQDIALQDLVSMSPPPTQPAKGYFKSARGVLEFSPETLIRATQDQIALDGAFNLELETASEKAFEHQQTSVATEVNYMDSRKLDGAATISRLYSGILQQNIYLRNFDKEAKFSQNGPYLYALANYYHNLSLGLKVAKSYGGGIGWDGDHGHSSYTLAADFRYIDEGFYGSAKSLSGPGASLIEQYAYTFKRSGVKVGELVSFLPVFNNGAAYLVRATGSIAVPIDPHLSLGFVVADDYLANAPPKHLQNYVKYMFDLKYSFNLKDRKGAAPK
jgi:Protein of unknown function, DUF481